jgi:menaquinol-cytochrome c reductase iron-sulfur subunit
MTASSTPDSDTDEASATETEASPERRRFLATVAIACGGAAGGIALTPVAATLATPWIRGTTRAWRNVGKLEDFPIGATVKVTYLDEGRVPWGGFASESAAWVRREDEQNFIAFSMYCTHTGCPLRWEQGAEMFLCPCHGGAFYRDGSVAAGPPPSPLPNYPIRVRDGSVELLPRPLVTGT